MRNPNRISRTRRPALFAALAATGLLAAGLAIAAPQGKAGMHGSSFETLDANGDGAVSTQEFDAVRAAHLAELDGNNDGMVSFDEHKAAREARIRAHFVSRHDQDGDGRVSVDEMAVRGEGHFERMDRNGDGSITRDELRRRHHRGMRGEHGQEAGE